MDGRGSWRKGGVGGEGREGMGVRSEREVKGRKRVKQLPGRKGGREGGREEGREEERKRRREWREGTLWYVRGGVRNWRNEGRKRSKGFHYSSLLFPGCACYRDDSL